MKCVVPENEHLLLEKLMQLWNQHVVDVSCPALPDDQNLPACGAKAANVSAIPDRVGGAFGVPEF